MLCNLLIHLGFLHILTFVSKTFFSFKITFTKLTKSPSHANKKSRQNIRFTNFVNKSFQHLTIFSVKMVKIHHFQKTRQIDMSTSKLQ